MTDPVFAVVIPPVTTDAVPVLPGGKRPGAPFLWQVARTTVAPVATSGPGLTGKYVGTPGAIRYVPAAQYQLISSDPQGPWSCTAYATAEAVDAATYGGDRVTGAQIRALSPAAAYTGLTLPDAIHAAAATHIVIVNKSGSTWKDLIDALRHGRGVVLQGDYDQIPAAYSGQISFRGNHAVFIDYLHSDGQWMYVMDPLHKAGAQWIPVSIMRKFAEKVAKAQGIFPGIYFAVTRPTRLFQ